MGYYNQPLGDVPKRGGFKVGGGAFRSPMGPPRSRPGQSLGAGGGGGANVNIAKGQVPTRTGAVVGGIPTMKAITKTLAAQGLVAEGAISKGSNFDPSMLEASRESLVKGYADRLQAEARQRGGRMSSGKALRQSEREFAAADAGLPIPAPRPVLRAGGIFGAFNPPQMPLEPNIDFAPSDVPMIEEQVRTLTPREQILSGARMPFVHRLGDYNIGNSPVIYTIGDEGLEGFSLKGIVSGVSKAVKKVASPVQKAAAAVGHTVGNVVTSKVGQAIIGTTLAATGVGIPAAAAIMAASKGVGNLIKPGGNIKHAVTGALQGAATGVVAGGAGKLFQAVAPGKASAVKSVVQNIESKFVQGGKIVGKGVIKGVKGAEHVAETVVKGAVKGTGKVVGGVLKGAVSVGKKIIGIPGSFMPTERDPNGDGINEDNGLTTDEAGTAEKAGRARRGSQIPRDEQPRVGSRGQFPRSPRDPWGTGIDEMTGGLTPEAAGAIARGAAVTPDQLPADAPPPPNYTLPFQGPFSGGGGGGGGGGGFSAPSDFPIPPSGLDAPPVPTPEAGGLNLSGLLGNVSPMTLGLGAAAVFILPRLLSGGGSSRGGSRRRSTRRRR